jgi:hypothetical protein
MGTRVTVPIHESLEARIVKHSLQIWLGEICGKARIHRTSVVRLPGI